MLVNGRKKSTLINKILMSFFDNRITFKSWLMRHFSAHNSGCTAHVVLMMCMVTRIVYKTTPPRMLKLSYIVGSSAKICISCSVINHCGYRIIRMFKLHSVNTGKSLEPWDCHYRRSNYEYLNVTLDLVWKYGKGVCKLASISFWNGISEWWSPFTLKFLTSLLQENHVHSESYSGHPYKWYQ